MEWSVIIMIIAIITMTIMMSMSMITRIITTTRNMIITSMTTITRIPSSRSRCSGDLPPCRTPTALLCSVKPSS